ncbi:MAG: hypothetical protein R3208_11150 [Ketobacteraceae bacterium]|nr:hypothetical protein [Ketobacteraceae bacterium]
MRTIHKYEVNTGQEPQAIEIPTEHTFLSVEYIIPKRSIFLWVEVPADLTIDKETCKLKVFRSGDGIPDNYQYLGTCIDQYLPEAYHLYKIEE